MQLSERLSMSDDHLLNEILDHALELPESQQQAYLDKACAGLPDIREKIERLLADLQQAPPSRFLEDARPVPEMPTDLVDATLRTGKEVRPGTIIDGKYRIVRRLGQGGMGVVFLAERADGQFLQKVAIKVIRAGVGTEEAQQRFIYERQILAQLEHPNIARLYDGGVTPMGSPYIVMEYVEGEPIDAYCDRNKLSIRQRVKLFRTVCEAVRHAQRNLIVHRDLKPGNILVTKAGEVKLLDFGIAKLIEADDSSGSHNLNLTTDPVGPLTPAYAAPEQVKGERVNAATDVYALGVILYELLTGQRPYLLKRTASFKENLDLICEFIPQRPSSVVGRSHTLTLSRPSVERPGNQELLALGANRKADTRQWKSQLSGDLDAITMMALKKESYWRYASAGELLSDIERFLGSRPVQAREDTVRYRGLKFFQRNKVAVLATFVALGAAAVGGSFSYWQYQERKTQQESAEEARVGMETVQRVITGIFDRADTDDTGQVYFSARDLIEAGLSEFDAMEGSPELKADMLNEIGQNASSLGELELADSLHHLALELQKTVFGTGSPETAISLMRIGGVFRRKGEFEIAGDFMERALEADPHNASIYSNYALVKQYQWFQSPRSEYLESAKFYATRALEMEPDNPRIANNLAIMYYYEDDLEMARELFERALEIDPAYTPPLSNIASIAYYQNDLVDAARYFRLALQDEKNLSYWSYLASSLQQIPDSIDNALAAHRMTIKLAEESVQEMTGYALDAARGKKSISLASVGEYALAQAEIDLLLENEPSDSYLLYDIGFAYLMMEEERQAILYFSYAIRAGYPKIYFENDPGLNSLRGREEYAALMRLFD